MREEPAAAPAPPAKPASGSQPQLPEDADIIQLYEAAEYARVCVLMTSSASQRNRLVRHLTETKKDRRDEESVMDFLFRHVPLVTEDDRDF